MNDPQLQAKKKAQEKRRALRRRKWQELRLSALTLVVLVPVFFLITLFLLVFPRSKVSNIENRNLAAFPKFTLSSYFSGEFTAGIATWYDDTVPFRDSFKNKGYQLLSLTGFSGKDSVTFINANLDLEGAAPVEETKTDKPGETETVAAPEETPAVPIAETEADQKDYRADDAEVDWSNGLLVVNQDGHWKCLALFGGGDDTNYVNSLNTLHEKLGDGVTIYSMPAPLASQFYVPSNAAEYSSDQSERFDQIAAQLDPGIVSINLCPVLQKHTEEEIYLRTDHHWAPLGAYYACRTFAEAAGVPFADLSAYEEKVNPGYVGTMYAYSEDARILNDPEDFVYYVPQNQYRTFYYDTYFNYEFENDLLLETDTANSYMMFMGGDARIVKIKTDVNNGRKLIVIKDSYGNAEIPFYTGSFQEIYVVDMRYFAPNLVNFIQDLGITDVLFTMCAYSVVGTNAENLPGLLTQNADLRVEDPYTETEEASAASPSPEPTPSADGTEAVPTEAAPENDASADETISARYHPLAATLAARKGVLIP